MISLERAVHPHLDIWLYSFNSFNTILFLSALCQVNQHLQQGTTDQHNSFKQVRMNYGISPSDSSHPPPAWKNTCFVNLGDNAPNPNYIPVTSRREVVVIHPGIPSRQVYLTQQYLQPGIQQTNRGFSIYFRGHHYNIYNIYIYYTLDTSPLITDVKCLISKPKSALPGPRGPLGLWL